MNKISFKHYGKHLVAVALFIVLAMAFFYPMILENKTLLQYDIKSGKGWGRDAREYYEKQARLLTGRTKCSLVCLLTMPICPKLQMFFMPLERCFI